MLGLFIPLRAKNSEGESPLKRLEKNSDIDAENFDTDKKRFYEMKNMDQDKIIAGRSISEILY